jgi:histidine triad (HIT) family protein
MRENKDCIFCKITVNQIPAKKVYEDDEVLAFEDINPQAPVHILIIPKNHIETLNDLDRKNAGIIAEMTLAAGKIARERSIDKDGYRLVLNCNSNAGQTVFHIHMHLLGGRIMGWPPG